MKNKNAQASALWAIVILIGVVVIVGGVIFYGIATKPTAVVNTNAPITPTPGSSTASSTAGQNGLTASFGNLVDLQSVGTVVSMPTVGDYCRIYTTSGTTQPWGLCPTGATFFPGMLVDFLLVNGTTYHNTYIGADTITTDSALQTALGNPTNSVSISASTFPLGGKVNKNASASDVIVFVGTNTVLGTTTASGTANITSGSSNGNAYTLTDTMQGTSLSSTQDMVCVLDLGLGVNATSTGAIMSGNGAVADPKWSGSPGWYVPSRLTANSATWIYDIPALTSSAAVPYTIVLQALPLKQIGSAGAAFKKTCYTKEYFIDPVSGLLVYDVADSLNNVKSAAVYTQTVYFTP